MKKSMWRGMTAVAASIMFGGTVALAANLANPSFEESDTSAENTYGDRAASWGRWGNWMNRETGWKPVRTGSSIIGYHHWEIESSDNSGLYQDFSDVAASKPVTFSIYASKDEKANFEKVELRLEPFDGGETLASQFYTGDEIKGDWTRLSVSGTTSAKGGVRVLVICYPKADSPRDGALRLDDAELVED